MPILILAIAVLQIAVQPATAQLKFGFVDTQKILANFQKAKDAFKQFETERNTAIEELSKLQEDIRAAQQQIEQQSLLLSEQKKREKQQELQNMVLQFQQSQQDKDQGLAKRQEELLKPVYDEINAVIRSIREKEGYDFIIDSLNLLDAKPEYDLTDKVMKELGVKTTAAK